MTLPDAQRLCEAAIVHYGDHVQVNIDDTFTCSTSNGYRVILRHKALDRQLALRDLAGWGSVKDAWSAALEARR